MCLFVFVFMFIIQEMFMFINSLVKLACVVVSLVQLMLSVNPVKNAVNWPVEGHGVSPSVCDTISAISGYISSLLALSLLCLSAEQCQLL